MFVTFYCIPNAIGLKFENSTERDTFLNQMQPALTRAACERVAMRSLRFHPARMKTNFVLRLETPNGAMAASPAAPLQVPMPEVSDLKTVLEAPQAVAKEPESPLPKPEPPPEASVDVTPPDPDPEPVGIHKNSRKYRDWKARHPTA